MYAKRYLDIRKSERGEQERLSTCKKSQNCYSKERHRNTCRRCIICGNKTSNKSN